VAEDLRIARQQPRHPQGGRRQWEAMQAFDAYDRLPSIAAPTLVVHGTQDRVVAPGNARVLASRIPGAELLLLQGAGHLYHSERAAEADAAVLGFVRRHAA
jgi:pimeloyl-ACP methyl ester carboxylesterase